MKPRGSAILVILIVVILLIGWAIYAGMKPDSSPAPVGTGDGVICTMDAMMCPDGSYVGRVGPNCQFAACPVPPTATSSATTSGTVIIDAKINQTSSVLGLTILPLEIIEDSRCPIGVQCIQAGTVRIRVTIGSVIGQSSVILPLNSVVTTASTTVELTEVTPASRAGTAITPADYRFKIRVKK